MEAVTTAPKPLVHLHAPKGLSSTNALTEAAKAFARAAKADRTLKAYAADWRTFTAWCGVHSYSGLPAAPTTVALYLTARATEGRKVSTIARALAAISQVHRATGHPSPRSDAAVQQVFNGIKRTLGTAPRQRAPLLPAQLLEVFAALPSSLIGARDRAMLAIGFAGAFRRSELVTLNVSDVIFTAEGAEIVIRRSKTDQEGAGRKVGIPFGAHPESCPVRSLKVWLGQGRVESGPLFREVTRHGRVSTTPLCGRSIAKIIKRRVEQAGMDPEKFSGHSLRAGLVTAAAKSRKTVESIMRQTGHRSVAMVHMYIRDAQLFDDNAASGIGL
jgi:integrase